MTPGNPFTRAAHTALFRPRDSKGAVGRRTSVPKDIDAQAQDIGRATVVSMEWKRTLSGCGRVGTSETEAAGRPDNAKGSWKECSGPMTEPASCSVTLTAAPRALGWAVACAWRHHLEILTGFSLERADSAQWDVLSGLAAPALCGPSVLSRFWTARDPSLASQQPPTPPSGGGLCVDVAMEAWDRVPY